MSELSTATDAPPPPPPPPPPADTESREPTPDASPELANALSRDGQDAGQSGSADSPPDAMATAQEQADPVASDLQAYLRDNPVEGLPAMPQEPPDQMPPDTQDQGQPGTADNPQDAMATAQEQADPVASDLQAYLRDNPVEDPSAAGTADSSQDPMARAREQAEPVGNELQAYLNDSAVEGPAGLSPELTAALPQESELPEAPGAGADPVAGSSDDPVTPQALTEEPDTTQAVPVAAEQTRGADTPSAERPDVASEYPAEYVPSADPPPNVDGPHESPESWAADINPDRDAPGRDNNCADCARSVDSTWHGDPAAAAAMANPDAPGEPVPRMSDWAGEAPQEASMSDVQQRLEELGPGSSAIVGFDRDDGTGHWFNAVNDDGTIKAVDGQSGLVETWPPSDDGLGFNENDDMSYSDAVFFTADGKVVKQ